jgi:hypothetical protein
MAKRPNAEMAMKAWCLSRPSTPSGKVATQLPKNDVDWKDTGFIVVRSVGGSPDVDASLRHPVLSMSIWTCQPGSQTPPWNMAFGLAEALFDEFYKSDSFPYAADFTSLGYDSAKIMAGYPLTEPVKVPGNESAYAQVSFDAAIHWVA